MQGAVTAASVGLGCGTCCGSGISAFLFGYLTTHTRNFQQSARAFLSFYLGKTAAVCIIFLISSRLGAAVMDENGYIGAVPVRTAADLVMIGTGVWLVIRWFRERKAGQCAHCHHCGETSDMEEKLIAAKKQGTPRHGVLLSLGAAYGASPCAPLILMAGYASTMPASSAVLAGGVFAFSSAMAPMLLLLALSGVLAPGIRREMPQYLDYFRLLV